MGGLTHIGPGGDARMVEVGEKAETAREATAEALVRMSGDTLERIVAGDVKKGDVLGTARLAGIMAAKRTADLVPLCHPIAITGVDVAVEPVAEGVRVEATVRCRGRTGVEMEALTAASVAALTVYDMAKALERSMSIEGVRLLAKSGGRSGGWRADADEIAKGA